LHWVMRDFGPGGDAVTMWICQWSVVGRHCMMRDSAPRGDAVTMGFALDHARFRAAR
jgi:hypothetical protein